MARRLLLLSGLAILAVVVNHSGGVGQISMFLWADRYQPVTVPNWDMLGTFPHYALLAIRSVGVIAVPAFLFIAGFFSAFAALGGRAASPWKGVLARLKFLLIPYFIWSAVVFVGDALQGNVYAPFEYLRRLFTVGANQGYYFMPLLCYIYLLAPLIVPIVKTHPERVLIASAVIQLVGLLPTYALLLGAQSPVLDSLILLTPQWSPFSWSFLVVLGMVACLHANALKRWLLPLKKWLLAAVVVLFVLNVVEGDIILTQLRNEWGAYGRTLSYHLCAIAALLAFVVFEQAPPLASRWLSQLGKQTFGIYLVHLSIIEFASRVMRQVVPGLLAYQLLLVPIMFVLGLGGSLLLMAAASKSPIRRYYRYAFG